MIGLPSINGYPLPIEQRLAGLRQAGFEAVLLWWGLDEAESRRERVRAAHAQDMHIENVHAGTDNLNALWYPGQSGEQTLAELLRETEECAEYGVNTMVLHLTNGKNPPSVTPEGVARLEKLVLLAERSRVRLAFENMRTPSHTEYVLDHFASPFVGFCYDSGHHHLWTAEYDWLGKYANRLLAIHLHDNTGAWDAHRIPFDGAVDWQRVTERLKTSSYRGAITLEAEFRPDNMYDDMDYDTFLKRALAAGKRLEDMLNGKI